MINNGPLYGLENWILFPPISAILAIFMLLGANKIGEIALRSLGLIKKNNFNVIRVQTIPVGIMIIGIFLYPLALMQVTSILFMQIIAIGVVVLGIIDSTKLILKITKVRNFFSKKRNLFFFKNLDFLLIISIIFLLFLISLGPITNADSLDYHIGYAIAILNNGGMPIIPEWFIGLYSSNGEVINALALSIGSEQFGSLVQWGSLIAISGLVWPNIKKYNNKQIFSGYLIVIAIISSPVILFLLSGPKPQLWPVAMTCFAFYLYLTSIKEISSKDLKRRFFLVCLLCMSASIAKFNYLLGGTIAGTLMFSLMVKRKELLSALFLFLLSFIISFVPHILWKMHAMDSSAFEIFTNPLPIDIPGIQNALASWKMEPDISSNTLIYPISIIIPNSFGSISAVLGIGWILFLKYKPLKKYEHFYGFLAVLLLVTFTAILSPPSGRMYIEAYFWCLILCSQALSKNLIIFPKYFFWIIRSQAYIFLVLALIGAYLLFPGSMSEGLRKHVMSNSTSGYNLMEWVNKNLPNNAVLINGHRSMALVPRKSFNNYFWKNYVDQNNKNDVKFYLDRMKLLEPTHILIINDNLLDKMLSDCFGKMIAGPEKFSHSTRNPFNSGSSYTAVLYKFQSEMLPSCAF